MNVIGNKVTLSKDIVWINVMSLSDDDNMIFTRRTKHVFLKTNVGQHKVIISWIYFFSTHFCHKKNEHMFILHHIEFKSYGLKTNHNVVHTCIYNNVGACQRG